MLAFREDDSRQQKREGGGNRSGGREVNARRRVDECGRAENRRAERRRCEPHERPRSIVARGPRPAVAEQHEQRLVRQKRENGRRREHQRRRRPASDDEHGRERKQQLPVRAVLFRKHPFTRLLRPR